MRRTEQQSRGVPNERTALAWTRSAMALAVIAALMIRSGAMNDQHALAFPAAGLVLIAALAAWRHGVSRYHDRSGDGTGYAASPAALRAIAAATAFAAVAAAIFAVSA